MSAVLQQWWFGIINNVHIFLAVQDSVGGIRSMLYYDDFFQGKLLQQS